MTTEPTGKINQVKKTREEIFNDYDGFVEKFKPKKTTDDCYTPEPVYKAVTDWIDRNITPLDGVEIVRPFWPGGDYENHDYPEGCIVIDNPPFSILAKIRRFFHSRGIRYFLFAPTNTMCNSAKELSETFIICAHPVTYENGAKVPSSFLTNLDCGGTEIWCAGSLSEAIRVADEESRKAKAPAPLPVYQYPMQVASAALLRKISRAGVDFRVGRDECIRISRLDCQKASGNAVFGGGWLLSERAAAERAAAERAAAERAAAERAAAERAAAERAAERKKICWSLSDREKEIVARLGQ